MTARVENVKCVNCGRLRDEHWIVNYADGQHVGGVTLICPTSTFKNALKGV